MNITKTYTAAEIKANIQELDKVSADLQELIKKYKSGSIGNKILVSYYNQNLRKIKELCEELRWMQNR